jgi:hypothetical protein
VKKFLQEQLKLENKNRKCTMPFDTKEFMKLMNTVRPVMLLLVFFLVLQNKTIGFKIKSL